MWMQIRRPCPPPSPSAHHDIPSVPRSRVGVWVPSPAFLAEQRLAPEAAAADVAAIQQQVLALRQAVAAAGGAAARVSPSVLAAPRLATSRVWRPAGDVTATAHASTPDSLSGAYVTGEGVGVRRGGARTLVHHSMSC
jgi:hypothetical protein